MALSGHHKWSEIKHKRDDMAMRKYADGESKLEVLRGHEAETLARFEAKVGKNFSQLEDDERKELHKLLNEASRKNADDEQAAQPEAESTNSNSDSSGSSK
jgi:hypothetical protein